MTLPHEIAIVDSVDDLLAGGHIVQAQALLLELRERLLDGAETIDGSTAAKLVGSAELATAAVDSGLLIAGADGRFELRHVLDVADHRENDVNGASRPMLDTCELCSDKS